jgi:hypothetical protein
MGRRFVSFICIIILLSVTGGCLNQDNKVNRNPQQNQTAQPLSTPTGVICKNSQTAVSSTDIDLMFDTSISMRGYLFPGYTRYSKVVEGLATTAQTLVNANEKLKMNYYQFGEKFAAVKTPDKLNNWDFYNDKDSNIDLAITNANLENLTIIVTDLGTEEEEAFDKLINKIGSQYISKGYAIGILGIKSEYEGYVYSVGEKDDQIVVLADNKPIKDTYPFYVLVLGKQENIINFYDNLKNFTLNDFQEEAYNFTLIPLASKGIISNVSDQNFALERLNAESSIFVDTDQFIDNMKANRYKISRQPRGEVGFKISGLNYETIKYMPVTNSVIDNKLELQSYDSSQGKWIPVDRQDDIVRITDLSDNSNKTINMEIAVNPDTMICNTSYAVCISSYIRQGSEEDQPIFKIPDWVAEWTTDKKQIPLWKNEYAQFKKKFGEPSTTAVADKYRSWLKSAKIQSVVHFNTTKDLDKIFKKIYYYVEKGNDIEVYRNVFYITKLY